MAEFSGDRGDVYLLFGKNGWIGGQLITLLTAQGKTFHLADSRSFNRESVVEEINKYNPTHVLNAAGVTGRPNVDWCEDHKMETVRTNVVGTLTLADICAERGIHHLLYATGCIFEYDEAHTIGGVSFTEEDKPNFHGNFCDVLCYFFLTENGCLLYRQLLFAYKSAHGRSLGHLSNHMHFKSSHAY